jgi:hypothetical protein
MELWAIREQLTAEDVIDFKLAQLKDVGVLAMFSLFFEHFDLVQGDTIELDSTLFDGEKWFIESFMRDTQGVNKLKFRVKARKWFN